MIRLELLIVSVLQFTNMAAPRGLVKTVIPVSLKENSNLIICIQYLGHHYKTACQKSAKSMRYRVRPDYLLSFYSKLQFMSRFDMHR